MISAIASDERALRFSRRTVATGALLMLLAVILGAVGSHLLQARLTPPRFASYQAGVLYHLVHALGLILVGVLARLMPWTRWIALTAGPFALGLVCFSGSIYAMTFGAPRTLGMVAPVGGISFMLGWACLALHAWRSG